MKISRIEAIWLRVPIPEPQQKQLELAFGLQQGPGAQGFRLPLRAQGRV